MSLNNTVHIKGLSELGKYMEQLAPKLQKNVLRAALKQGAKVVKEAAKANCPVGEPSSKNKKLYGGHAGALRDSLRYDAKIDLRRGMVVAYVRAGGKARGKKADTYYAHMVEYGTSAHRISSKKYGALWIDGKWIKGSVNHPGAIARPFLRPALDAEQERALKVIANFIKNRLDTKHGIDTRDIDTGGEE